MTSRSSVFTSTRDPRVAIALIVAMLSPGTAFAQHPQGGRVVQGSATIATPTAATTTITQRSQRAIIDWKDFSIGAGGVVNIQQPGAAAALLNRVTGGQLSVINGQLQANGRVYLINPQGIVVGPNGAIDTAAFVGSTLNTSNEAFMSGEPLTFAGDSKAGVINLGTIRTAEGDVVIIAASIANGGSLVAERGTAALLSSQEVLYAPAGDSRFLIKAPLDGGGGAAIENRGVIRAAEAVLKAAGSAYALAVNNSGLISATAVKQVGGRVILDAGEGDAATSGTITAQAGDDGGTVNINGGQVDVASGAAIRANAAEHGNGGSVAILADGKTRFSGLIEARGGAEGGDGGSAEVSGHKLTYRGHVDTTAPAGKGGSLLLDPTTIESGDVAGIVSDLDSNGTYTLSATDSVTIDAAIVDSATEAHTLTLDAPVVTVNADISLPLGTLQFESTGGPGVSLTSSPSAAITARTVNIAGSEPTVTLSGPVTADFLTIDQAATSTGNITVDNASNAITDLNFLGADNTFTSGDVKVVSNTAMNVDGQLTTGTGAITLVANGDLTLNTFTTLTTSGQTTLAARGGGHAFINNAGAGLVGGAGRVVIYSGTDAGGFNDGLGYSQFNPVSYGSDPQSGLAHVIYIETASGLPLLTITADGQSIMYGSPDPTFTASYSGGSATDLTSPVLFQVSSPHANAGSYVITPHAALSSTYRLSFVPGTLTVTRAPLLISGPTLSSPYGSAIPALTPLFSGLRGSDGPSAISGLVLTTDATSQSPVGAYAIVPSGAVNSNYTISYANGGLTITPAVLRIIANSGSRLYGAANPLFSASYRGFVNGDTPAVVSGLSFSTLATERSAVGDYPIVASGGSASSNYAIEYVPGRLTINPAPLSVWTTNALVTYGEAPPTLTNTVTGLVAGDTVASLGVNYASGVVRGTSVGKYRTTLVGSLANYQVAYTPGLITVSPRTLFIIANHAKRFQFEANPAFTANISGLFGIDMVSGLRLETVASTDSPADTYAIVPSADAMPNYDVHLVNGTLEVQQAPSPAPPITITGDFHFTNPTTASSDFFPPVSDVRVNFAGTDLSGMLNNSPAVINRVLGNYESMVEGGQGAGARLKYLMSHNLAGENNEVGKLLPFLVAEAKEIIDRPESSWTSQERAFINYMTATIAAQKKAGAEDAYAQLQAWKAQQQSQEQGVGSLLTIPTVPPAYFLQQAQTGVAMNADNTAMVVGLLTTAGAAVLATGAEVGTGVVGSVVSAIAPMTAVGIAAGNAAMAEAIAAGTEIAAATAAKAAAATVAEAAAGAAATVGAGIIVILAVIAVVTTSIQVANATEYDNKMKAAVADAQKPMTNADLKALLSDDNGQQAAFMYLVANTANNIGRK